MVTKRKATVGKYDHIMAMLWKGIRRLILKWMPEANVDDLLEEFAKLDEKVDEIRKEHGPDFPLKNLPLAKTEKVVFGKCDDITPMLLKEIRAAMLKTMPEANVDDLSEAFKLMRHKLAKVLDEKEQEHKGDFGDILLKNLKEGDVK